MQEVEAYGGKFFVSGLQETLRSIFETSRLDRIFRIFPDVDAALAARSIRPRSKANQRRLKSTARLSPGTMGNE
jgi:hypothetical protein